MSGRSPGERSDKRNAGADCRVAQSVRVAGKPRGRRFESDPDVKTGAIPLQTLRGRSQAVRHRILIPFTGGSNPSAPASNETTPATPLAEAQPGGLSNTSNASRQGPLSRRCGPRRAGGTVFAVLSGGADRAHPLNGKDCPQASGEAWGLFLGGGYGNSDVLR